MVRPFHHRHNAKTADADRLGLQLWSTVTSHLFASPVFNVLAFSAKHVGYLQHVPRTFSHKIDQDHQDAATSVVTAIHAAAAHLLGYSTPSCAKLYVRCDGLKEL